MRAADLLVGSAITIDIVGSMSNTSDPFMVNLAPGSSLTIVGKDNSGSLARG
jgi:hypothetical protein